MIPTSLSLRSLSGHSLSGRSLSRILAAGPLLLALPVALLSSRPAQAQLMPRPTPAPVVIAMMPFDGKDTATPPKKPLQPMITAAAIADALSVRPQATGYRLISADLWSSLAKLRTRNRAADLRSAAKLLNAKVLIGGFLEATPGNEAPKPYRLTLTLYDVEGQMIGQLGYDLDKPTLSGPAFASQATAFFQMLDQAVQPPATQRPPVATAQPGTAGQYGATSPGAAQPAVAPQIDDKEDVPLLSEDGTQTRRGPLVPQSNDAREIYDRRSPWVPALDLRFGFLWNGRELTNEGSDLKFPFSGAPGIAVHAELYPLAFLKNVGNALAGIGARIDVQRPFWSDIQQKTQVNGGSNGLYSASEYRVEGGLRWHYNPWDRELRPDFELEALYGLHTFATARKENIDYLRIAPAEYRYAGAQLGVRMFFTRRVAARAGLTLAKLLSLGLLDTSGVDGAGMSLRDANGYQSYGPGSGMLWRLDLGLTVDVYRGLTLGAGFYHEQNRVSFQGQGNIYQTDGRTPVTAMKDAYTGILFNVGYAYRPWIR